MIKTIIAVAQPQLSHDQIAESDTSDYGYEDMDANRQLNENAQSVTSDLRQGLHKATTQRRGSAFGRLEADSKRCSSNRAVIQESDETDYGYGDADVPERPDKATPSMPTVDPKQAKVRDRRGALRRPQDVSARNARRRGSACGRIEVMSETSSTDKLQGISQSSRRGSISRFERQTSYGSGDTDQEVRARSGSCRDLAKPQSCRDLARQRSARDLAKQRSTRDLAKQRSFRDLANIGPAQAPEDKAARRDRWLRASQLAQDQVGSDKSVYGYEDMDAKIQESDETNYGYGDTGMPEKSGKATPSVPVVNPEQVKVRSRGIRRVSIGASASVKEIQKEFQKDPHVVPPK
jgi:hypothetical protein